MRSLVLFFLSIIVILFSTNTHAQLLFEGYYKLELDGKHVGYVIQKYEFDKTKNEYYSTNYIHFKQGETLITEKLKAVSQKDFRPKSYNYKYKEITAKGKIKKKFIDAKFKGDLMTAKTSDGPLKLKIEKNSILSTFLIHKMLATGLKNKTNYPYNAVSEEDGNLYTGFAKTNGSEVYKGKTLFKIQNDFNKSHFTSLMDSFGHVYMHYSPVLKLRGTLLGSPTEATKGFRVNKKMLEQHFGSYPSGKNHSLVK